MVIQNKQNKLNKKREIDFFSFIFHKELILKSFKRYCNKYLSEIGYFNIINCFLSQYKISISNEKEKILRDYLYKEVLQDE